MKVGDLVRLKQAGILVPYTGLITRIRRERGIINCRVQWLCDDASICHYHSVDLKVVSAER